MYDKIIFFTTIYNILTPVQHSFRENVSTQTAVLEFLQKMYNNLNNGNKTPVIFMDLRRASDLVNQAIFLEKLHRHALRRKVSSWISLYQSDRYQFVKIN